MDNKKEIVVCCAVFISKLPCPAFILKLGTIHWGNCNRDTAVYINSKDEIKNESLNNNARNFLSGPQGFVTFRKGGLLISFCQQAVGKMDGLFFKLQLADSVLRHTS